MKNFISRTTLLVAILGVGGTVFGGNAKDGSRLIVTNCYRNITAAWTSTCAFSLVEMKIGFSCPSSIHLGKGLTVAPLTFMNDIDCGNQNNFFCCAKLALDDSPCPAAGGQPAQPSFLFTDGDGTPRNGPAKISAIFCRPTNNF